MQFKAKNHSSDKFELLSVYKQDHLSILNYEPQDDDMDSNYTIDLDLYSLSSDFEKSLSQEVVTLSYGQEYDVTIDDSNIEV